MPTPQLNNPAGRLYAILSEVRKTHDTVPIKDMWAKMFGVPNGDIGGVLAVHVELVDLVRETRKSIEALADVDNETYLKPIVQIETAFSRANLDVNCTVQGDDYRCRADGTRVLFRQTGQNAK